MIKKMIIVGGATVLVGLLVFGRSVVSYVRTSANYVSQAVKDSVPIEFEIKRARDMLKDLEPEVRKNMHVIAKEEVEVQRLNEQISEGETRLVKQKGQLMQLTADLKSGQDVFKYAGRTYSTDQVRADLTNKFERYKTSDATLASLKKVQLARQKSLDAARQKLEGMLAAKRQIQVEIENLEAQRQMIAAAQATSQFQFDDSRLGRLKELVSDLKTRLDIENKVVNAETEVQDEIPMDQPAPENIVEQVTTFFGDKSPKAEAVATK